MHHSRVVIVKSQEKRKHVRSLLLREVYVGAAGRRFQYENPLLSMESNRESPHELSILNIIEMHLL